MQRLIYTTLTATALALTLTTAAQAETVTYPGAALRTLYDAYGNATNSVLAPSGSDGTSTPGNGARSTAQTGNSVTRASGTPDPFAVYGAVNWLSSVAAVTDNKVFITSGNVREVAGAAHELDVGYTTANRNSLTVSGGTISGRGSGGYASSYAYGDAQANDNIVRIEGGTHPNAGFWGGYTDSYQGNATANDNTVTLAGTLAATDEISNVRSGYAYSDHLIATANDNKVDMQGGTVKSAVYGGRADTGDDGTAVTSGNTATLSGGSVGELFGGWASGDTHTTASNNTVDISGGTLRDGVIAGRARSYGGDTATASNNTLNLSGTPDLSDALLYGGWASDGDTNISTGNTLRIATTGLTAIGAAFFQRLQFVLPATPWSSTPLLRLYDKGFAPGDALTVALTAPGVTLHEGDALNLMSASTLNGTFTPLTGTLNGFAYKLTVEDDTLVLTIGARAPVTPTASATSVPTLNDGALAGLVLLLMGMALVMLRRGV
jgi:hypothetical protein